jgi:SAM-dependent methyltransferase
MGWIGLGVSASDKHTWRLTTHSWEEDAAPAMKSVLRKLYHRLPTPPSTNYLYQPIRPNPYHLLPPDPVIIDIGSKEAGGSYAFGSPPPGARVTCVDIAEGPGVDLVADAHDLHMIASDSVDCVTSVSVLEHVRYPQKVVKEIFRILKPGGVVYINVPFVFPFHADPDDFYRFSHKGIRILCEDFECVSSGFNRGPASTMHHLLVHFMAMLFSFNSRTLYGINVDAFKWILFWVKYLDRFLARYDMAYVIHAGSYFIGRKPAEGEPGDQSRRAPAAAP